LPAGYKLQISATAPLSAPSTSSRTTARSLTNRCVVQELLTIVAAPTAGARIFVSEPAKIFRAVIAYDNDGLPEQAAKRVISRAALWLFSRNPVLLLLQQDPVKLVIFTHRSQHWAAA
jgi:hypothetical protein